VKHLTLLILLKLQFPFSRQEQFISMLGLQFETALGYYALVAAEIADKLG
jgi:hypothetical protein